MRGSNALRTGAFAGLFAISGCFGDFHLSASNLDIAPNPAMPGDIVLASFVLGIRPTQPHTIVLTIGGDEHVRITRNEQPPLPYVITLGDAADLIATYGVGTHLVRVEVRAEEEDETARSQSVSFELRQAAPSH